MTFASTGREKRVRAWILILCGAASAASLVMAQASGASTRAASAVSQELAGSWDSGPFPMSRVRAVAEAAGYSPAVVNAFISEIGAARDKTFEMNARFYRQGGMPLMRRTGWDPTKGKMPSDGDWGP